MCDTNKHINRLFGLSHIRVKLIQSRITVKHKNEKKMASNQYLSLKIIKKRNKH